MAKQDYLLFGMETMFTTIGRAQLVGHAFNYSRRRRYPWIGVKLRESVWLVRVPFPVIQVAKPWELF